MTHASNTFCRGYSLSYVFVPKLPSRLIAEELTLQELRKAHHKTQTEVAKELGMAQDQVSRLEQRSGVLLSTLRRYGRHGWSAFADRRVRGSRSDPASRFGPVGPAPEAEGAVAATQGHFELT